MDTVQALRRLGHEVPSLPSRARVHIIAHARAQLVPFKPPRVHEAISMWVSAFGADSMRGYTERAYPEVRAAAGGG